jgi:hypothetical protein
MGLKRKIEQLHIVSLGPKADSALIGNAILLTADLEAVKMDVLPAHGGLDDVVQLGDRRTCGNEDAAPDRRADAPQSHAQLTDHSNVSV